MARWPGGVIVLLTARSRPPSSLRRVDAACGCIRFFILYASFFPSDLSPSAPSRPPLVARLAEWLRHFWPAPLGIDGKERLRFVVGAVIGVLLTAWLSRWWAQGNDTGPWMVASLGASAVLVFGMPSSSLAQPWPVLGGSTLSALVGAVCSALIPTRPWRGLWQWGWPSRSWCHCVVCILRVGPWRCTWC